MSASYMVCKDCEQEVDLHERFPDDDEADWRCETCGTVTPVEVHCDMSDEAIADACRAAREAA